MKSTLNPYLNFNGNAAKAMKFYKSVLGGKLTIQTFGEAPMPSDPKDKNKVVHAALTSGAISIFASDGPPDQTIKFGDSVSLCINGTDEKLLTKYFRGLGKGGKTIMKLEKQFWGDKFGIVLDKFGIQWMVNIASGEQK